jgi:5-methylcytosine-specific restriction endonuclease McrA
MMSHVLVLNADFTPLNITSLQKSMKLILKGKAEILKEDLEKILTVSGEFIRPLIIRLFNYVKFRPKAIKISRHRIYARDNHQCVYCGSKRNLTLDHIIPRSKGGPNTWSNMVTSCSSCNVKKGDKSLEQAKMRLNKQPYEPQFFTEIAGKNLETTWENFKRDFF